MKHQGIGDQGSGKTCPSCGEQILAASRRCRYCGHRFGQQAGTGAVASLLGFLRRSAPSQVSADVLAQLGIDLAPGEQLAGIWVGHVEGEDGYVVLTDARLYFAAATGLWHRSPLPRQRRLDELAKVEMGRQRGRPILVTCWKSSRTITISGIRAKELELISSLLRARIGGPAPG